MPKIGHDGTEPQLSTYHKLVPHETYQDVWRGMVVGNSARIELVHGSSCWLNKEDAFLCGERVRADPRDATQAAKHQRGARWWLWLYRAQWIQLMNVNGNQAGGSISRVIGGSIGKLWSRICGEEEEKFKYLKFFEDLLL